MSAATTTTTTKSASLTQSFGAQNFTTVGADNSGYYMIPPDPNAAVGTNYVITATNTGDADYPGATISDDLAGVKSGATYNNDAAAKDGSGTALR